jgi:hypothetical protein
MNNRKSPAKAINDDDSWGSDHESEPAAKEPSVPAKIGVKRQRNELNEDFLEFDEDDTKFN